MSAVERAAEVLAAHVVADTVPAAGGWHVDCRCGTRLPVPDTSTYPAVMRQHQAEALAAAGLLPSGTEWGVESRSFADSEWDGLETDHISSYDDALLCIARWYPQPGRARVVHREVGPWVEVPS